MNSVLFSPRRRPYEFVLFAAALLALFVFAVLDEYRFKPTISPDYTERVERGIDSVAGAHGIDPDTTTVTAGISVDNRLTTILVDSLGTLETRRYLQRQALQEARYDVVIRPRTGAGAFNISLSSSRSRNGGNGNSESALLHISFDTEGRIVGVVSRLDSLAGTPPDTVAATDSTRMFHTLLSALPLHYRTRAIQWKAEKYDPNDRTIYTAVLDSTAMWTKSIRLSAQRWETEVQQWSIGWSEEVTANYEPKSRHSRLYDSIVDTLQSSFLILIFVLIIIMTGAFVLRLRKKAVSITFCVVSSLIVAAYFFVNSFVFMELPLLAYIIIIFTYSIISFLFVGMPIAGIFSLIRERYAERFYTLVRLKREPWNSMYVGRSILFGLSAACITSALSPTLFFVAERGGWLDVFRNMFFNSGLYFLAIQPQFGYMVTILFISLITVILITVAPALTARLSSHRLRFYLSVAGACLFSFLFPLSQSSELADGLLNAVLGGLAGILLFYVVDVLALFIFALGSSSLSLLAIFEFHPVLYIMLVVVGIALLAAGIKAYASPAETVHEEEYKPLFVYQLEEEKRILQELAAAQSVQKRLLPTVLPQIENVRVAASCIPALEVGGDYYDFFRLDDHRLGVLIGDVSGKGMSAAFYITLAKGVIVSQIHQAGTPADVLKRVNSLVYGVLERGKFISLIYGILDTSTREFAYANAGHNPPLLHRAGGQPYTDFIRTKGMAIGLDNGRVFDAVIGNHTLFLHEGDVLLLYTDGVTEAMDYNGNEYGDDRMKAAVKASPAGADNVVASLISAVMKFIGKAKQHDDITVVAVEIAASPVYRSDAPMVRRTPNA